MRLRAWVLCCGASLGALASPGDASAYVRTRTCDPTGTTDQRLCAPGEVPKPLAWPTRCLTYFVNLQGSDDLPNEAPRQLNPALLAAIQASADAWNQPPCVGMQLRYGGLTCNTQIGFRDRNVRGGQMNTVMWRESYWPHQSAAIAITSITSRVETGEIRDADIEMNGFLFRFDLLTGPGGSRMDVQNTMTHEFGHVLGLDHELNIEEATMFPSANPGEVFKRDLHQDDVEGLCAIYPFQGEQLQCSPARLDDETCIIRLEGEASCQAATRHARPPWSFGPLGALGALALLLGLRAAHRRLSAVASRPA